MTGARSRTRLALLAVVLAAFAVLLILVVTRWGPLHHLDHTVDDDLNRVGLDHPGQVTWWLWVSRVLHPDVERACAAVAAVALWLTGRRRPALLVVAAMVVGYLLEVIVKLGVGRVRPTFAHPVAHAPGGSFPSGHALTSVVAWGLLVLLAARRWRPLTGTLALVAVLLVGFSRLALGVHYPTDVLGGWLLGGATLLATCEWFARRGPARVDEVPPAVRRPAGGGERR